MPPPSSLISSYTRPFSAPRAAADGRASAPPRRVSSCLTSLRTRHLAGLWALGR